jgi:hypothetical protein
LSASLAYVTKYWIPKYVLANPLGSKVQSSFSHFVYVWRHGWTPWARWYLILTREVIKTRWFTTPLWDGFWKPLYTCIVSFPFFLCFWKLLSFFVLFALSCAFRVSFVCSLALVHVLRVVCEFGVIFTLAHVFRVSFVCSVALVHVFRGSLWVLCSIALFKLGFGITCTYASCKVHSCHISFSTSLYHRLHLHHKLWRMCFSHIHWSSWYVGHEFMIMLVSSYDAQLCYWQALDV